MHKRLFGLLATASIAFAACSGTTATTAPTAAPTGAATAAPTAAATAAPTSAPTAASTAAPTGAATEAPTTAPTVAPTVAPTAAATPAPTIAPPDLTTTTYAPETAAKTGGTVVVAEWQFPDTLNTYYAQAFTDNELAAAYFNGMTNLTQDLKYIPDLASNIPLVSNGDVVVSGTGATAKMDVTWKMRDGMKWSDGQPITCDDLIGTWKWIMDKGNTGLAGGTTGWEDIATIDGAGSTTCVVHFKTLYSGYLALFSPILPAHYLKTVPVADAPKALYPIGDPTKGVYSGPYIPTELKTDAQVTLVPNPNWATISGHAPYLDKLIWKYYGDAAGMVAGFKAGEFDVANNLNNADIPSLSDLPKDQVIVHDSLTYELMPFNNAAFKKKFGVDGPTVIKALRTAIDTNAIASGPLQGTVNASNNFISPLTWYYKDQGGAKAADPGAAEQMLKTAGFVKGSDGIYAKNGVKVEINACTSKRQVRIDTQTLVASQMAKIGVKWNVNAVPAQPDFFGAWNDVPADTKCNLIHGNYDVGEHAYISPLDPIGGYNVYHSSGIPENNAAHNGQNETRINIPALDAAYDIVKGTVDFSAIRDAMGTVQDIYGGDQNTFELPLYYRKDVWLVDTKIHNFTGNPSTASGEWNVGDWWIQ